MLENKTKTLEFNSADYPLSQFVVSDGEELIVAPDVPTESEMRVEALKFVGREALSGVTHAAKATGEYLFYIVARHYPGE